MPAYKDNDTGTWYVQFYYQDWTGVRKKKFKRGFSTKKEALNFENDFVRKANANMDMTLSSFVEVYFKDKVGELKERSIKNKKYMIESHVIPFLGNKPMNVITPSDIIAWQNEIRDNNNFSQSYLRMIQNQVTALFTHAQKIYGLENNPCKRVKKMGKSDNRSIDFWIEDEYQKFISTYDSEGMHYVMFEILFWTGCREGELLALTMNDFNIEKKQMSITKTFYRSEGRDIITEPKTENSVRTIELPDFLIEEITAYYERLYRYPKDERLFPIGAEALQHTMKNHIKKAGVKQIRVHDLRHSHVAYLIHNEIQPLIIKERLGHKDIKVTLNTYGHLYPSEQRKVAGLLDSLRNQKVPDAANIKDN